MGCFEVVSNADLWFVFRYGEIFKTHILGCPCVMLSSPEAARFVLVTRAHLFKPTYPKSKEKMIGPSALFFHQGDYHAQLRKLVQSSLSPDSIRKLVPSIEALAISALESWAGGQVINTFHAMKKVCFCLNSTNYYNLLVDDYVIIRSMFLVCSCITLLFSDFLALSTWPFFSDMGLWFCCPIPHLYWFVFLRDMFSYMGSLQISDHCS